MALLNDISQPTRRAVLALFGAAAVSACASLGAANAPLTLDQIIRRNTLARGGGKALDRMRSALIDVEIDEGGQKLNGHYAASSPGLVRIDVYASGKNVFSEGVDGSGGWQWEGGSEPAKQASEAGRAALLNGAENHMFGWHRFAERGNKLALMPTATLDGTTYSVVEVRYLTGQVSYFYVDPTSWQAVRRRDERAYHPDNDPTKQTVETVFSNFVAVDGVIEAHLAVDHDLVTGKALSTNRTLARRINPALPKDYFDRNRRAPGAWVA